MRLPRLLPALLVPVLVAVSDPAFALRCGSKLVREGDPKAKILKICGEPDAVQRRSVLRAGIPPRLGRDYTEGDLLIPDRSYVEVIVEEWTYNFGPRRLMRIVRFENGLVREVEQLGYGYRE